MPVVVRAVHVLIVRVLVIDLGVVQLVVRMRRTMPVLMRVNVLVVMRMAVGMLMHHVAMTVRMTMGVRMRVGVTMLVRMAVRLVVAMAVLVFHLRVSGTGGELTPNIGLIEPSCSPATPVLLYRGFLAASRGDDGDAAVMAVRVTVRRGREFDRQAPILPGAAARGDDMLAELLHVGSLALEHRDL